MPIPTFNPFLNGLFVHLMDLAFYGYISKYISGAEAMWAGEPYLILFNANDVHRATSGLKD